MSANNKPRSQATAGIEAESSPSMQVGEMSDRMPPSCAVEALNAANKHGVNLGKGQRRQLRRSKQTAGRSNVCARADTQPIVRMLSPFSQRRHSNEADVGWAAGVLDGEGCVHIARQTYGASGRRPTYRLRLYITQNDELLLKEFEWIVGVAGRLYSPKPTRKQNKTCHSLVFDGERAFTVLERLYEYLRRKKTQAALAVDFRERCDIHRHFGPNGCPESLWELREWYYERMSDLKRS